MLAQITLLQTGAEEKEKHCHYYDSSLEQYSLLILSYDYPKTSMVGACPLLSSEAHTAGSHAARHMDVFLPQRSHALAKAAAAVPQPLRPSAALAGGLRRRLCLPACRVTAHASCCTAAARSSAHCQGNLSTHRRTQQITAHISVLHAL